MRREHALSLVFEGTSKEVRAGIVAGLVACAVFFGGLWFLNNTRPGLQIKCSLFTDLGACFLYELSEPRSPGSPGRPQPTDDPATVEARRQADEADRAVDDAAGLKDAVADVREAVDAERAVFEELEATIEADAHEEFWVDDVSFKLDDVEFARDDVDFAREDFGFSIESIEEARARRADLAEAVRAAISNLESAQWLYPDASAPTYSAGTAEGDLERLLADINGAVAAYEAAGSDVDELIVEADEILEAATALAASVSAD